MIECVPHGICSWNYLMTGEGHQARLEFNWMSEQGSVNIDGSQYLVRKGGIFSGRWTMESTQGVAFTAEKPSSFFRTFEIAGPAGTAILQAQSALGRTMTLEGGGNRLLIAPAHLFTRRAEISGSCTDFHLASFAFWLTALLWRRAANNNNSGGTP